MATNPSPAPTPAPAPTPTPAPMLPTVGRRVYVWVSTDYGLTVLDESQALDGGILYVHHDGKINVLVTDHVGNQTTFFHTSLTKPTGDERHGCEETHATWMPYQVSAAQKAV